jgi:hypothetical protein
LPDGLSEIFLSAGLDGEMSDPMTDLLVGQFSVVVCWAKPVNRHFRDYPLTGDAKIDANDPTRT